jgi:glycyl-tRNA synthetase
MENVSMEKIVSLAKRKGFVFAGSEIYGGLANAWDYGPLGVALKNNVKQLWWRHFVQEREDMYGLDAALLMNRKVWQASGHEAGFSDPLVECKKCHGRFREDTLEEKDGKKVCPACGNTEFTPAKEFNLMLKTFLGPAEEQANVVYFRPETAQAMFVDFKNVLDAYSPKFPFGIAQIGKAFRNEITPGNFIFRTREFEQMEIEYFIRESGWEEQFEYWLGEMKKWMALIGLDESKIHYYEVPADERAHYSKRTVDIEFDFPFGKKELYGLAYRGDFDLASHEKGSGKELRYFDEETKEKFVPHVIEPSLGVDRTILALLSSAYREDADEKGESRVWLDFNMAVAPYKAAVFPLLANKPELVAKAREVYEHLKGKGNNFLPIAFDKSGNVGKRYRRQDEIGTPYCFTVDFQTLEDGTITVRSRNTMQQERIHASSARMYIEDKM